MYPVPQQYYQQPVFPIETRICQRGRGDHVEGEFYCGRTLPINYFSKGRGQCKDCSSNKTKAYNAKKALLVSTSGTTDLHLTNENLRLTNELGLKDQEINRIISELTQEKANVKKYTDGYWEYVNKNESDYKNEINLLNEKIRSLEKINRDLSDKSSILDRKNINLEDELEDISSKLKSKELELEASLNREKELNSDIDAYNGEIGALRKKAINYDK